jgi:hypothetical protein
MAKDFKNDMQCSQFETLLADALDGVLPEKVNLAFEEHSRSCPLCGPMFTEVRQGMLMLHSLDEVEPPRNLVHNILAATSAAAPAKAEAASDAAQGEGVLARVWKWIPGTFGGALHPRFVSSFAMAFFSLSLTLALAGVHLKDIAHMSPSSVKKAVVLEYTQLETKVVKYYENMRIVYEIESRMRELRKNSSAGEGEGKPQEQPKEEKKIRNDNDTSGRPEKKQEHYSDLENGLIACLKTNSEGA